MLHIEISHYSQYRETSCGPLPLLIELAIEVKVGELETELKYTSNAVRLYGSSFTENFIILESPVYYIHWLYDVNVCEREGVSKLTTGSSRLSFTPAMISTKCLLFFTNESMKPAMGDTSWAICLGSSWEGVLMSETIGFSGTPSLWTLRNPYILGGAHNRRALVDYTADHWPHFAHMLSQDRAIFASCAAVGPSWASCRS